MLIYQSRGAKHHFRQPSQVPRDQSEEVIDEVRVVIHHFESVQITVSLLAHQVEDIVEPEGIVRVLVVQGKRNLHRVQVRAYRLFLKLAKITS